MRLEYAPYRIREIGLLARLCQQRHEHDPTPPMPSVSAPMKRRRLCRPIVMLSMTLVRAASSALSGVRMRTLGRARARKPDGGTRPWRRAQADDVIAHGAIVVGPAGQHIQLCTGAFKARLLVPQRHRGVEAGGAQRRDETADGADED